MGPGIRSQETIPAYVEMPEGAGVMVVAGKRPGQAIYEPFTPDSHYEIADVDINISIDGTYYVAVYNPFQGGKYGFAIGYQEEFEVDEWILVPVNVIRIHLWEGQSLAFILAPMVAIVVIGCATFSGSEKKEIRRFIVRLAYLEVLLVFFILEAAQLCSPRCLLHWVGLL